jgi:hypothetical protein
LIPCLHLYSISHLSSCAPIPPNLRASPLPSFRSLIYSHATFYPTLLVLYYYWYSTILCVC